MTKKNSKRAVTATLTITVGSSPPSNPNHNNEFEKLMADWASGSDEAAWHIAEHYTPHILRAVRRHLPKAMRAKVDSQDFAQIVWVSMLMKRSYLARVKSPEQLIAILVSAAQHRVIDAYRRLVKGKTRALAREIPFEAARKAQLNVNYPQLSGGPFDRNLSPSQTAGVREKWCRLCELLSPRDRKVLTMRIRGFSYDEISASAKTSRATIKRIVSRAIEHLNA